jgi:hypothetical protein
VTVETLSEGAYLVRDGHKWYRCTRHPFKAGWHIVSHQGRVIRRGTPLHRSIIAAIEAVS